MIIKKLTQNNFDAWKVIRMEALTLHPEYFAHYVDEEDDALLKKWLDDAIFGAFEGEDLVGVVGFYVHPTKKTKHRGTMFSVYVRKEHRGKGIADQLVKSVLEYSADRVMQVHCSVIVGNEGATNLYKRNGFEIIGKIPNVFCIDGKYYDDYSMVKINHNWVNK